MMRSEFDLRWRRVSNTLSALLRRTNTDCFVIFTEADTRKFVQFSSSPGDGLACADGEASAELRISVP